MQIISVLGDGNCLYHALLAALHNLGRAHDHHNYASLKAAVIDFMSANRWREGVFVEAGGSFKPDRFATAPMTLEQMLQADGRDVEEYLQVGSCCSSCFSYARGL